MKGEPVDLTTLPKAVRRFYVEWETIGHPITVERPDGGWRLSMSSDRVQVVVDFVANRQGRTDFASTSLVVDGESREPANDGAHLRWIFHNPDGRREFEPLTETLDPDQAPVQIRNDFRMMANALKDKAAPQLGREGKGWVIALDTEAVQVRLSYRLHHKHFHQTFAVTQNGIDRTHEVGGSMSSLIAMLTSSGDSTAPATPVGKTASSTRSNAVETRRQTVIRT